MQVRCLACGSTSSLDTLVEHEAASRVLARVLEASPVGTQLVRYLALHRPQKQALRFGRVESLLSELLPDIERQTITRNGRQWAAPPEVWRAAIEVLLAKRDKGDLRLPLSGHGLLLEVMAGIADKAEAAAERSTEADRRQRGAVPGSAPVSSHSPPLYRPEPSSAAKPTPEQLDRLKTMARKPVSTTVTPEETP